MSLNIKKNGQLVKVAGSTVILDATASEIRSGTFSLSGSSLITQDITFTTPMPDTNYVINIECSGTTGQSESPFRITNKTVNGFTLAIFSNNSFIYTGTYYAIRLVELEGYTEIQNKIANPDTMPTENSTNLVESGGVYEMIKSASSVFVGTAAEWEDVTTKEDYQLAVITDKEIINSVDETTGDTAPVADFTGSWTGTTAEWAALSISEKVKYKIVNITDDYDEDEEEITTGTATPASGVSGNCYWSKVGKVVSLTFQRVTRDTAGTTGTMFTGIPKPANNATFLLTWNAIGQGIFNVLTTGEITVGGVGTGLTSLNYGSVTYMTND